MQTSLPLLHLLKEICIFVPFRLVLLLKAEIDIVEFVFEHLVFMIESLTDFIQFFVLFPILVDFLLLREALLSQLSDLDFVVGKIEELSLVLL